MRQTQIVVPNLTLTMTERVTPRARAGVRHLALVLKSTLCV